MNRTASLIILGFVALTAFLRFYQLDLWGFEDDEKATIDAAMGIRDGKSVQRKYFRDPQGHKKFKDQVLDVPHFTQENFKEKRTFPNVIRATIGDNGNAVFFNIVLHYWIKLVGYSTVKVRALNAVVGILTVGLLLLLFRRFFSKNLYGLLIIGFLGSFYAYYAHFNEVVRGYSLAILLVTAGSYALLAFFETRKTLFYIWAGICFGLAMLCHYFALFAIGFWVLYILVIQIQERKVFSIHTIKYAGIFVISVAVVALWLVNGGLEGYQRMSVMQDYYRNVVEHDLDRDTLWWLEKTTWASAGKYAYLLLTNIFGSSIDQRLELTSYHIFYLMLCLGLLIYGATHVQYNQHRLFIWLTLAIVFLQLGAFTYMAWGAGHVMSLMRTMYAIFVTPMVFISLTISLLSLAASPLPSLPKWALLTVLFGNIAVVWIASFKEAKVDFFRGEVIPDHVAFAGKAIKEAYAPQDTVIFANWDDALYTNYFLYDAPPILQKVEEQDSTHTIYLKRGEERKLLYDLTKQRF